MKKTVKKKAVKRATTRKSTKPYCVIRTFSAGVHVGILESRDGREVVLSDSRRIWKWSGANTLNEIALRGIGGGKVSEAVASITLTEAIEVIPCTAAAEANLRAASWQI